MPTLASPFLYANIDDVKLAWPFNDADWDVVVSSLPNGEASVERWIEIYSRKADTWISKRFPTPIKVTPHLSITSYVVGMVKSELLTKFGTIPASEVSAKDKEARTELNVWLQGISDPGGLVAFPNTDAGTGPNPSEIIPQTMAIHQSGPYPESWRTRGRSGTF